MYTRTISPICRYRDDTDHSFSHNLSPTYLHRDHADHSFAHPLSSIVSAEITQINPSQTFFLPHVNTGITDINSGYTHLSLIFQCAYHADHSLKHAHFTHCEYRLYSDHVRCAHAPGISHRSDRKILYLFCVLEFTRVATPFSLF